MCLKQKRSDSSFNGRLAITSITKRSNLVELQLINSKRLLTTLKQVGSKVRKSKKIIKNRIGIRIRRVGIKDVRKRIRGLKLQKPIKAKNDLFYLNLF